MLKINNPDDELKTNVLNLIEKLTKIKSCNLSLEMSLFHDLGLDGEDAMQLIQEYSKEFNVDIQDFCFDEYFGNEGAISPFGLITMMFSNRLKVDKKRLSINDLVQSANKGLLL